MVAAGRNRRVLDQLAADAADATIRLDRPHDELAAALAAEGPYDLVVDYLWGRPAEAVFAALARAEMHSDDGPQRILYVLIGMSAGEVAGLSAITLRSAPVRLIGSGTGRPLGIEDAAPAYEDLLRRAASREIILDVDPVPLAMVERSWTRVGGDRRIVFVP